MRKRIKEDREHKVWCMGADLRLLQAISLPNEEWDYMQRLVDEPLGDCYLVSNRGRVYNTSKQEMCKLYEDSSRTRYVKVSLEQCPEGHKNYNLHQLVALAFVTNPRPGCKKQVHHIDSCRNNNDVTNLLWATPAEQGTLHSLKNHDLVQYYEQVAKWRKEQPIKLKGNLITLEVFEEPVKEEKEKV